MRLMWIAPLAIMGILAFIFIVGTIVMHLWNWLLPELFGWSRIGFWQTLGLLALCRILFSGGFHCSKRSNFRRRMEECYEYITPEERERFKQWMRERSGFGPSTIKSKEQ